MTRIPGQKAEHDGHPASDVTTGARGRGRRVGNDLRRDGSVPDRLLEGLRVLVAEDNVILSMHLAGLLEEAGAIVVGPFPFASEALGAIEKEVPDAAMLDYELGEGSSAPIAERLAATGVPFAFFTSHVAEDLKPWSDTAPVLAKPADQAGVLRVMSEVLAQRAS